MLLCEQFGIRSFELGVLLASLQLRIMIQFLQVQIESIPPLLVYYLFEAKVELTNKTKGAKLQVFLPFLLFPGLESIIQTCAIIVFLRTCYVLFLIFCFTLHPHSHKTQLQMKENRQELNRNLAQMLKGGVIMDVTTPEQAKIAEAAGACAVMALERIPADIRAAGGVSRMSDPKMIKGIQEAVTIPVMAKCRIGHIAEAQILQAIEIDYIDESEVLSPADDIYHIDKTKFDVPFVCGARNLGEALRRIAEGATMIRTKGEPGTGDVVQAVSHMRQMQSEIRRIVSMAEDELFEAAKQLQVPYDLVKFVHENGKLPVVNFAAGGVATPADAALMMQLGAEGVFVGSGIFKSGNPAKRAAAIVQAVTNYNDPKKLAELSEDLGEAMVGINEQEIQLLMAERGK